MHCACSRDSGAQDEVLYDDIRRRIDDIWVFLWRLSGYREISDTVVLPLGHSYYHYDLLCLRKTKTILDDGVPKGDWFSNRLRQLWYPHRLGCSGQSDS